MIVLISGKPNTGKSTALGKIIDLLGPPRCSGLLTEEILKDGERIGFSTCGLKCRKRIILAHKDFDKTYAVEDFGVDLSSLEKLMIEELETGSNDERTRFLIIDEIGRMQVMSKRFRELLDQIADSSKTLIASICYEDEIEYIRDFKKRDDVSLFVLNETNRNDLPTLLCKTICKDDQEYLGKLELAKKYAGMKELYEHYPDKTILHSTHGVRTITVNEGQYQCTCDYYQKNGTCSHIMSLIIS